MERGQGQKSSSLSVLVESWIIEETVSSIIHSRIESARQVPCDSPALNDVYAPYEDKQTDTILSQRLPLQNLWCLSLAEQKAERKAPAKDEKTN